jgi:hypothetical protein
VRALIRGIGVFDCQGAHDIHRCTIIDGLYHLFKPGQLVSTSIIGLSRFGNCR